MRKKKKFTALTRSSPQNRGGRRLILLKTNAFDSIPIHPLHILFPLFHSCFSSLSPLAPLLSIHACSTFLHTKNNLFLNPLQKGPDVVGSVEQTQQKGIKLHLFSKPPTFLRQDKPHYLKNSQIFTILGQ